MRVPGSRVPFESLEVESHASPVQPRKKPMVERRSESKCGSIALVVVSRCNFFLLFRSVAVAAKSEAGAGVFGDHQSANENRVGENGERCWCWWRPHAIAPAQKRGHAHRRPRATPIGHAAARARSRGRQPAPDWRGDVHGHARTGGAVAEAEICSVGLLFNISLFFFHSFRFIFFS